jgi:hypothetical protein
VDTAVSDAARAIYQAPRAGPWIPGQRQRLRQLAPGTWQQALADVLGGSAGRKDYSPAHPAVEIAIYPDVVWLAAYSLRTPRPPCVRAALLTGDGDSDTVRQCPFAGRRLIRSSRPGHHRCPHAVRGYPHAEYAFHECLRPSPGRPASLQRPGDRPVRRCPTSASTLSSQFVNLLPVLATEGNTLLLARWTVAGGSSPGSAN